jgi:hypothetical protein
MAILRPATAPSHSISRDGLIIRAGVTSEEGAIFSYLTDVDNTTNDSSYQAGFRFAL